MKGARSIRARNNIQLSNSIALTIFSDNAAIFVSESSQAAVDDDIETVAGVSGSPEDLAGVDLHPI